MGRVSTAFRAFFGSLFNGDTATRVSQALSSKGLPALMPLDEPVAPEPKPVELKKPEPKKPEPKAEKKPAAEKPKKAAGA